MSKVGDKALSGVEESVGHCKFVIEKQMTMSFEGQSINILDDKGGEVISVKNGKGKIHVYPGYKCYVIGAEVKFDEGLSRTSV